jgi:hypothetical protein
MRKANIYVLQFHQLRLMMTLLATTAIAKMAAVVIAMIVVTKMAIVRRRRCVCIYVSVVCIVANVCITLAG